MLEIEEWFMIRDLYAQGFSIRAISKKTGFDRRTVSKYLNNTSLPESKKRANLTNTKNTSSQNFTKAHTLHLVFTEKYRKWDSLENTVVDMYLILRGDLDNNGNPADAVDVNMMIQCSVGDIPCDRYFDLDENSNCADAVDVNMMIQASVGDIIL